MRGKWLKVGVLMALAMAANACGDEKDGSKACDGKTANDECLDASRFQTCIGGEFVIAECPEACTETAIVNAETGKTQIKACYRPSVPACEESVCKDSKTLAFCRDGVVIEQVCAHGCEDGTCQAALATCGNGRLDEGESCDGALFAEGAKACPSGTALAEGKTLDDLACVECAVVTDGVCKVDACAGVTCKVGACLNGVCVTPEQENAKAGDACTDVFPDFCNRDGDAVLCSVSTSTVVIEKCEGECKVVDLSAAAGAELKAGVCIRTDAPACETADTWMPYCSMAQDEEMGKVAVESSYYCAAATDGTVAAVDMEPMLGSVLCMSDFGKNTCSADGATCEGHATCSPESFAETCANDVVRYCDMGVVQQRECYTDEGETCLVSTNGRADCYTKDSTCTLQGATRSFCADAYLYNVGYTVVCTEMSDGSLRWETTASEVCSGACNLEKTACIKVTDVCSDDALAYCKDAEFSKCAVIGGEMVCYDDDCTADEVGKEMGAAACNPYYAAFNVQASSGYVCAQADDGSYIANPYDDFCEFSCLEETGKCGKLSADQGETCTISDYTSRCDNNVAVNCSGTISSDANITYQVDAKKCAEGTVCAVDSHVAGCYETCDSDDIVYECVDYRNWGLGLNAYPYVCKNINGQTLRVPEGSSKTCAGACTETQGCVPSWNECDASLLCKDSSGAEVPCLELCQKQGGDSAYKAYCHVSNGSITCGKTQPREEGEYWDCSEETTQNGSQIQEMCKDKANTKAHCYMKYENNKNNVYVDCLSPCTEANQVATQCITTEQYGAYTYPAICSVIDGEKYYVDYAKTEDDYRDCTKGCNAEGTACLK